MFILNPAIHALLVKAAKATTEVYAEDVLARKYGREANDVTPVTPKDSHKEHDVTLQNVVKIWYKLMIP